MRWVGRPAGNLCLPLAFGGLALAALAYVQAHLAVWPHVFYTGATAIAPAAMHANDALGNSARSILEALRQSGGRCAQTVYVITPTHDRLTQKVDLVRVSHALRLASLAGVDLLWLVVEDARRRGDKVRRLLAASRLNYRHLAVLSPTTDKERKHGAKHGRGMDQRDLALGRVQTIRRAKARCAAARKCGPLRKGVVYFADDDNAYDVRLFTEHVCAVRRLGMWAVGMAGYQRVISPRVDSATRRRVVGWDVGAQLRTSRRRFPVDMAAFAADADLIAATGARFRGRGCAPSYYETCFVSQLNVTAADVEPFGFGRADAAAAPAAGDRQPPQPLEVLVWHTRTDVRKHTAQPSGVWAPLFEV